MNNFTKYNDYKLLYLIKEGVPEALDILYNKYDCLINKVARGIYPYGDKVLDLIQEGRMIFMNCLEWYNPDGTASFYTYFYVSLRRRLYKLTNEEYYNMPILQENSSLNLIGRQELVNVHKAYRYCDSELEIDIFNECIIGNLSIRAFCIKYNYKYSRIYTLYNKIISNVKRSFAID